MRKGLEAHNEDAAVGILMLETTFPRIRGDIGNPATFPFPVLYQVVAGASPHRVVIEADPRLLQPFLEAAREVAARGARLLTTSCGFLAMFQRELAQAVAVPVYTSSLLQVHFARALLREGQQVGILTARKSSLTARHLAGVGIRQYPLAIVGMDAAEEFTRVFLEGEASLDVDKCRAEVVEAALTLTTVHPNVGAIVLECTNMPPFSDAIRQATGLPVFDAVTMLNYAYAAISQRKPVGIERL